MQVTEAKRDSAPAETAGAGYVALSRFTVANGMEEEVREAFRNRPHKVDGTPGFVRLEVMTPVDEPREIWLLTWWRDEASFRAWHASHHRRDSHQGIPKGLKLVSGSAQVRGFATVCT